MQYKAKKGSYNEKKMRQKSRLLFVKFAEGKWLQEEICKCTNYSELKDAINCKGRNA